MPRLIHIARALAARSILRSGVRGVKWSLPMKAGAVTLNRAVFAMPVVESFATTHQWVRELRAWHDERVVVAHLTLPRTEPVYVGRYGKPHDLRPLGEAIGWVRKHPAGAELVVPRAITAREVVRVKEITQLVGWVEAPEIASHYACVCPACIPAGKRDLQRRVRAALAYCRTQIRNAPDDESLAAAIGRMDLPLERARRRVSPRPILRFARSEADGVRNAVAGLLGHYRAIDVTPTLLQLAADPAPNVRETAVAAFVGLVGIRRAAALFLEGAAETCVAFIEQLDVAPDAVAAAEVLRRALARPEAAVRVAVRTVATVLLEDDELEAGVRGELAAVAARE